MLNSILLLCIPTFWSFAAQDPAENAAIPKKPVAKPQYEFRKKHDPDGVGKFYMGREIAQVMGHEAADWLERPEREHEENPNEMHRLLDIKPGMAVADIGAGSGYHTFRMGKLVGPKGKVFAVDIQQEMLDLINAKAKRLKVKNIETVMGEERDPKLKNDSCDLILLVDVYHEFSHPFEMAERMAAALKPGGRLVFVEFRLEDPSVPIKLVHKMSEKQILEEMAVQNVRWLRTHKSLPWQHVAVFEKPIPDSKTQLDKPERPATAAPSDPTDRKQPSVQPKKKAVPIPQTATLRP